MKNLYFFAFYFMISFLLVSQDVQKNLSCQHLEKYLDEFIRKDNKISLLAAQCNIERSDKLSHVRHAGRDDEQPYIVLSSETRHSIIWFLQGSFLIKSQATDFFSAYAKNRNIQPSSVEKIITALPEAYDAYEWDNHENDR